jgi:predicted MFS family arabinose efflux permease
MSERLVAYFTLPGNVLSTWSTIAAGSLTYFAAMQVMIIYGTWLADRFGLGAAGLGTVAFIFGLFDLAASVSVSLFTDRLGKRRAVLMGAAVAIVGYVSATLTLLPLIGSVALIGITRFGFEFAIVSYFPLLSEQQPALRNKIMTLGSAISLTFSTLAGFTAPWLYTQYGMQGVVLVSGVATVLAMGLLFALVKEHAAA